MSIQVTLSLRYLRQNKGLTQEELGRLIGVNRVTVLRWESGETVPSSAYVVSLARVLGVHTGIILDALKVPA